MNKPDGCVGCPLYEQPGPLLAQGSPHDAKFIYIVDSPRKGDMQEGALLKGTEGRIFNKQLYEAGIFRSEVFITSLVKCACPHPTPNLFDRAAAHCSKYLHHELAKCKSDVVVLSGQAAFSYLVGTYSTYQECGVNYIPTQNVNARMGCVEQFDGRKWIGTPGLMDYITNPTIRDECEEHLRKAKRLNGQKIPLPRVHTGVSGINLLEIKEQIEHCGAFSDDVETFQMSGVLEDDYVGGDYAVDLIGFSVGPTEALVIGPSDLSIFSPLYSNPALTNYQHNGMYDQFHVSRLLGHSALYADHTLTSRHQPWMDGMLAAHYHKSYKYKYLKPDCLSRYTDLPYYDRDIEKVDRAFYNGLDVMATHQECVTLTRLLKKMGCWDLFNEIGMRQLPMLEEARIAGVRIDLRKAVLFHDIMEWKLEESKRMALELCGGEDPSNPHVLKRLMYDVWKLPEKRTKRHAKDGSIKLTTTSNFDARQKVLADITKTPALREKYATAIQVLNLVDFYSGERKKLEFLSRISEDFKIHAYYKAHGAWSYRDSSTPNMQNWPVHDISNWGGASKDTTGVDNPLGIENKEKLGSLRSIVVADKDDDLLLSIDLNQVQVWIMAELSGCKWLRDIRNRGEYLYGVVYEKLYNAPFFVEGMPRTKRNKRKDVLAQNLRSAKSVPLGFLFGRSGEAVAQQYGWTPQEGVEYRNWFFSQCPELREYHEFLEAQMKQHGHMVQAYGNWTWFPEGNKNDALNAPAQSTEAFMIKESCILIDQEFKRRGWYPHTRIMLTVHDSITMNIHGATTNPQHLIDVYEQVVNPVLSRPNIHLNNAIFPHEAEVSYMWDWDTLPYDAWKEKHGAISRARGQAGDGVSGIPASLTTN